MTPIALTGIRGAANAITTDGTTVWIGTGSTQKLYRGPLAGGGATELAAPGQINNLALDREGALICTLGDRHEKRNATTGELIATCTTCGGNAMVLDHSTGELIVVNRGRVERLPWCEPGTTITPPISGNASAIDVARPDK